MGLILFYDTETTNKTDFKAPWDADHQPDLVQLGYKVYDIATREVVFEVGHLVRTLDFPTFNMSPEAQAVHGISIELLEKYGTEPNAAISAFQRWVNRCDIKVAHNDKFDTGVMQLFAKRSGWSPNIFEGKKAFCTMMSTTNICKIPGKYGNKWPTLTEAYAHFVNPAGFGGAHNALADVNACADIFWALVDRGYVFIGPEEGVSLRG